MPRPYFYLLCRDNKSAPWTPEFGDYSRAVVQAELDDYRDHDHKACNLKIIRTLDNDLDVRAAVAKLNSDKPQSAN